FNQRPVDRKMLIRQQRFDLRMVQKLGHELGEHLAVLQPVAVLREHGRVPHWVVGRKSHEPAVQKIVVQLLHQLAFRPDAVEHLQQQGAQQLLRRDRRTAFARVKPRKATVQLAQHIAHKLPDLSQRMVRRHPRLRRNVRKEPTLIGKYSPHASLRRFVTEKLNQQILAMARGFSANCYANYAFIDATFQFSGTLASPNNPFADANGNIFVTPGKQIPGIPRHQVKGGVDYWITPELKLSTDVIWVSSQWFVGDDANQNPKLADYWVANLHGSYQLTKELQIYGVINNLFNR